MELAGADADNVLLVSVKFPVGADLPDDDPLKARIAALTEKFQARFKRAPNQFAAQTYDAINLAARALAQGPDKSKVRGALEATQQYPGVGGVFNFSADSHSGLAKSDIVLINWKDGRFHLADYR